MKSKRTTSKLCGSVRQQLITTAMASVVAAISLLVFAQPGEAKIAYTPANITIGTNQQYSLDLNHDGVTDFTIDYIAKENGCAAYSYVDVLPTSGNGIVLSSDGFAAALTEGAPISPSQQFYDGSGIPMVAVFVHPPCSPFVEGPWVNVIDHYLGLSFRINGQTHYGWARLSVLLHLSHHGGYSFVVTLTGYAYETVAGRSIKAGQRSGRWLEGSEVIPDSGSPDDSGPDASLTSPIPDSPRPASLGILALGASSVPLWRQKESDKSALGVPAGVHAKVEQ